MARSNLRFRSWDNKAPKFFWKVGTAPLAGFQSDVLQILDCCHIGEAFSSFETEFLTACSATEIASDQVAVSFTKALINQLKVCNGQPWTTVSIFSELVRNKKKHGLIATPGFLPSNSTDLPIVLRKLGKFSTPPPITGREKNEEPRVIITAHVEDKITPAIVRQLQLWLSTGMPSNLLKLKVEFAGVFDTDSSLLEFRVLVEVWAMLRDDPAYRFGGLVRSGNRLLELAQAAQATQQNATLAI
ncbi:unnamed protein product [Alternaria alternata]